MPKKQPGSSRRARPITVQAGDIYNQPLTNRQLAMARRLAAKQVTDDDSDIDFSDIREMTDEELAKMIPLRNASS